MHMTWCSCLTRLLLCKSKTSFTNTLWLGSFTSSDKKTKTSNSHSLQMWWWEKFYLFDYYFSLTWCSYIFLLWQVYFILPQQNIQCSCAVSDRKIQLSFLSLFHDTRKLWAFYATFYILHWTIQHICFCSI